MRFRGARIHDPSGLGLAALLFLNVSAAQPQTVVPSDLTQMNLEDLMHIEVTSVSKKEKPAWKSGAAVFVITQEDIRRSGAANIPDVLRMVPGVDVARIDANTWAISVRGFNSRYATKLLVLVDGRTVYTPGFSGVYWDQQTVPMDDVERIEVVRGPGGTVWGANAVNGVINIITKNARETQGGLVSAGVGSEEAARGLIRYGGSIGANGFYRVYGNYLNVQRGALPGGLAGADAWHGIQGGFRSDWALSSNDNLTLQGDYDGTSESQSLTTLFSDRFSGLNTFNDKVRVGSENLLGKWRHVFSNGSEAEVQVYYDKFRRFDMGLNTVNTGDVDAQYRFHPARRHDVIAGIGYRVTDQQFSGGYAVRFPRDSRRDNLGSVFLQDEISLTKTLSVTVGAKLEHNAYTGYEYEPGAQIVWTPTDHHSAWASVTRSIQQPSWVDNEIRLSLSTVPLPGGGFGVAQVWGNSDLKAENSTDFEAGYRTRFSDRLSIDVTGFLSRFSDFETLEPGAPFLTSTPAPIHMVFPNIYENLARARTYGGELAVNWNLTKHWRISPGFSYLQMRVTPDSGSRDSGVAATSGASPKFQSQIRSLWNLSRNLQWDTSAYYVAALRGAPLTTEPVPGYTRVDTRIGYRIGEFTELSLAAQNLLAPHHWEFKNGLFVNPTEVERNLVVNLRWRF